MDGRHPRFDDSIAVDPGVEVLVDAYRLVADLFVYPAEVDREALVAVGRERVVPTIEEHVDADAAARLTDFLEEYEAMAVDEYVQTHELDPVCPLYLGHYEFDEPETCREIADADRNQYMVELNGIYNHFGFELDDELPDFLPAMVEFCWLTLPDRTDGLRDEFMVKMLTMLPGMREQFERTETPYWKLLATLETLLEYDVEMPAEDDEQITVDDSTAGGNDATRTEGAVDSATGGED